MSLICSSEIGIKNSTSSREGCTDDQPADIKNQVASTPTAPNTPKIYACSLCKICFEKFPSGQALGGHQRRHWSGNMPEQKTQSAPKILDFDLNELPKEEDEDPSSKY